MHIPVLLPILVLLAPVSLSANAAVTRTNVWNSPPSGYPGSHSLDDNYSFDPRDGWQTVNVTNLRYKYDRSLDITDSGWQTSPDRTPRSIEGRSTRKHKTSKTQKANTAQGASAAKSLGGAVNGLIQDVWKGLSAIGSPEPVTITWYTGHDLKNPSCWSNGDWSPTDASYVCAVTENGWTSKPQCFKFIELCNGNKKCTFVRIVDSCAGCAPGSKHVDLTKAAFSALADLGEGTLTVQMRQATDPDDWSESLWGPKAN